MLIGWLALALAVVLGSCGATPVDVRASAETDPVHHSGDAADDPCIWLHPTDLGLSTVIADDKQGGLLVYDLMGREIQWIDAELHLNNVDLRYGFPLFGTYATGETHASVDVVVVGNASTDALRAYKVNPATRLLEPIGDIATGRADPYGGCLYHSQDGTFHAFVTYDSGWTEQWRLADAGGGAITATKVRQFDVGSQVEGCVADDALGAFYVGEEEVAIWRYGAEPDDGDARDLVARAGAFVPDVEGLALYHGPGGTGYLIASSQGDDTFRVFTRAFTPNSANTSLGSFAIRRGAVDGVSDTDGIEVTNVALGPHFPQGLFVVQDGTNTLPGNAGNQNFKLVPWQNIALAFDPPLLIATSPDPRVANVLVPTMAQ